MAIHVGKKFVAFCGVQIVNIFVYKKLPLFHELWSLESYIKQDYILRGTMLQTGS
jgi:hypothetical protein